MFPLEISECGGFCRPKGEQNMMFQTNEQGVAVQPDRKKPQQIIPWDVLPQFIKTLENIRRQRASDLETSINAMKAELASMQS